MGNFAENLNLGNRFRPPWNALWNKNFEEILRLRFWTVVEVDFQWLQHKFSEQL